MNEKPLDKTNRPEHDEPEILVNEYGETRDSAVVVDEPDRTVLLTDDETIVIEKEPRIDVVPTNRPRKVYTGMWGQTELITVGLAMLALLTAVLIYVFLVIPANAELARNQSERERLQAELVSHQDKYGNISNTQTHVASLMSSVEDFEARYLPVAANGRTSLYQRINGLISAYGLVNTTGPDYAPLETVDEANGAETDEERGRAKYRSLFPGVYVTMTVEGSYSNLRRFIREVETGNDFVIVSAVELEPSDAEGRPEQPANPTLQTNPAMPPVSRPNPAAGYPPGFGNPNSPMTSSSSQFPTRKGKMHGEVVSLRLEMVAYFRRMNAVQTDQQ